MPDSEAKKRWMRENTVCFVAKVMKRTEPDLYDYLINMENRSTYIKNLIRKEIANDFNYKMFKVKEGYEELWQPPYDGYIYLGKEVIELSRQWEKPVEELLEQLTEV